MLPEAASYGALPLLSAQACFPLHFPAAQLLDQAYLAAENGPVIPAFSRTGIIEASLLQKDHSRMPYRVR